MKELGQYCTETQMFKERPAINFNYIALLRMLAEAGKLEHEVAGNPTGAFSGVIKFNKPNPFKNVA